MKATESLRALVTHLREAGISVEQGAEGRRHVDGRHWRSVWDAFCAIAEMPADEPFNANGQTVVRAAIDGDLLLHESGTYDGHPFVVSVLRQFSLVQASDGEYAGMGCLYVAFVCDRPPAGRVPKAQRWGHAGVLDWREEVEASNSFRAMAEIGPSRVEFLLDGDLAWMV